MNPTARGMGIEKGSIEDVEFNREQIEMNVRSHGVATEPTGELSIINSADGDHRDRHSELGHADYITDPNGFNTFSSVVGDALFDQVLFRSGDF